MQQTGLVNIDELVNAYLDESEQSVHKYFKCWQLAFRGMQEMGLDIFYQVKSAVLKASANQTIKLPADYLNYTKIGVQINGMVYTIRSNDSISINKTLRNGGGFIHDYYDPTSQVYYNYVANDSFCNLYSGGYMTAGGFNIDGNNGVIVLASGFGYSSVVMEYIASPSEEEANYAPIQFREAIIAYIRWKDGLRKGKTGNLREYERIYYNERRMAKIRFRPFNLEEAHQWITETSKLVVKV